VVEGVQDKEIGFVRAFLSFAHFLSFFKKITSAKSQRNRQTFKEGVDQGFGLKKLRDRITNISSETLWPWMELSCRG
jgi:hypothetical protein